MAELCVREITEAVAALPVKGHMDMCLDSYHFDTRDINRDRSLFFALESDSNDGHRYIDRLSAFNNCAAVVRKDYPVSAAPEGTVLIRVDDPLQAAQKLAAHLRRRFRHIHYVGVTGSAGKTTTKEFIYQLLGIRYQCFRSLKNWNNWIGLPFSLLNMSGEEDTAVFEMAMSDPGIGEIDRLSRILRPDVAVILNALPVHLEFLKTVENVAQAKSEILNYIEADDIAFVNGDSPVLRQATTVSGIRVVRFGRDPLNNDIVLKKTDRLENGTRLIVEDRGSSAAFFAPVINALHLENLFAAIVVARHLGVKDYEIREALTGLKPVAGRGTITVKGNLTLIDDTYNSNPEALKGALLWVDREFRQKKIAVLGDMLELGEDSDRFHREAGQFWAGLSFDRLVTVGPAAEHIASGAITAGVDKSRIKVLEDAHQAGRYLASLDTDEWVVLLKASRGIDLGRAIEEISNDR